VSSAAWIELAGARNVRDLGGLAGASGVITTRGLLRGDNLDALTDDDVRRLTDDHGLRAVVDLRNRVERPEPPEWIARAGLDYHHVPLFDLSGETTANVGNDLRLDVGAAYRRMLELAGPAIAQVLAIMTADGPSDGAVVVHCAAGKDRTGIVVAVLLRALDVPDDVIVADYLATAERIDAVRAVLQQRELYRPPSGGEPLPPMTDEPIRAVLAALDAEPAAVAGYLARWGVTREQLMRFTDLMLPRRRPPSPPAGR
jgi:protein-tyrosine phosphatase